MINIELLLLQKDKYRIVINVFMLRLIKINEFETDLILCGFFLSRTAPYTCYRK